MASVRDETCNCSLVTVPFLMRLPLTVGGRIWFEVMELARILAPGKEPSANFEARIAPVGLLTPKIGVQPSPANFQLSAASLVQAHLWFGLAAAQGDTGAQKALPQLERAMSSEQIEEAGRLRDHWRPKRRLRPEGMKDWEWLSLAPSPVES